MTFFFSLGTFARQRNEKITPGNIDLLQTNAAMPTLAASVGAKFQLHVPSPSSPTAKTRCVFTGCLVRRNPEGEAMSSFQSWEMTTPPPMASVGQRSWYALQTRCRHEKIVAYRLQERGVDAFLPTLTEVHRWSDRKKRVELPLFTCYVFARLLPTNEDSLRALRIDGVFSLRSEERRVGKECR